jgi:hypothetical protein
MFTASVARVDIYTVSSLSSRELLDSAYRDGMECE